MLPPDKIFDDASDEEWSAYLLWHMRENYGATEGGFTLKGLISDLGIKYERLTKYTSLLSSKGLIKTAFRFGNSMLLAPSECDFAQPELTDRQQEVLWAMIELADEDLIARASYTDIADQIGKKNGRSSIPGIIETLYNKDRITIVARATAIRLGEYQIAPTPKGSPNE